jgi:hypothetical protein
MHAFKRSLTIESSETKYIQHNTNNERRVDEVIGLLVWRKDGNIQSLT